VGRDPEGSALEHAAEKMRVNGYVQRVNCVLLVERSGQKFVVPGGILISKICLMFGQRQFFN
jgi:hypothetical protein